jgi:hypothetical protein
MLMRKTRGRFQTQLWDLFHPLPQTPRWEEVPRPMKRQLIELLARLLREQGDQKAPRASDKEVDHE